MLGHRQHKEQKQKLVAFNFHVKHDHLRWSGCFFSLKDKRFWANTLQTVYWMCSHYLHAQQMLSSMMFVKGGSCRHSHKLRDKKSWQNAWRFSLFNLVSLNLYNLIFVAEVAFIPISYFLLLHCKDRLQLKNVLIFPQHLWVNTMETQTRVILVRNGN